MKKSGLLIVMLVFALGVGFVNLNAENAQTYRMDQTSCEKYINLSRDAVKIRNLPLAQAYAKKAIQANTWDKLAWANYNDIIQQIADNGDVPSFGTVVEQSKKDEGPSAKNGPVQLEGC